MNEVSWQDAQTGPRLPPAPPETTELAYYRAAARTAAVRVPEFVEPLRHDVLLGGLRFHYLDWGIERLRPAVFLHGGGLNAHTWDLVCLVLRQRFHCFALDQRGHGDSDWSAQLEYATSHHVEDLERFVDALDLRDFLLVGMSMGATNSLGYAARHADRVNGLVLIDIQPGQGLPGSTRIREFMAAPAELTSVDDFIERALRFNPRRDPALLRRSLLRNLRQLPDGRWTWKYDRRHRVTAQSPEVTAAERAARAAVWEKAGEITCPTLYVRGAESDVTSADVMRAVAAPLPNWEYVEVEGAGHTVQGDNPAGLLRVLTEFADRIGI